MTEPYIQPYLGVDPQFGPGAWVAPGAVVVGDVVVGEGSSVWYNAVIRGDVAPIRIGDRTNVQDLTMVHVTSSGPGTTIGDDVTIGHRAVLHACTVGNAVLVGMGAILLDGVVVEDEAMIGAGALVAPGTRVTARTLWLGAPAKMVRALRDAEIASLYASAKHYRGMADNHAGRATPSEP